MWSSVENTTTIEFQSYGDKFKELLGMPLPPRHVGVAQQ
jgi:hypothetical protein